MKFDDFEPFEEYPTILMGKFPFRVYRSRFMPTETDKPITSYRYHFGFPKKLVEPICLLLETTVYWGEAHWHEHEGFWIWHTYITGRVDQAVPYKDLDRELASRIRQYNHCIEWYRSKAEGAQV